MSDAQLDEILLLRSSLLDDEFSWRGTEAECKYWNALVRRHEGADIEDGLGEASAAVDRDSVQSAIAFALKLVGSDFTADMWLHVELPPRYPQDGGESDAIVSVAGPACPRLFLDEASAIAKDRLQESRHEGIEHRVFDVFTVLQSYIADHPLPTLTTHEEDKHTPTKDQSAIPAQIRMARVIFWSHHLKAPSKRKDMAAWCSELQIWGITRPGYPGFLIFEGSSAEVDVIIKRIKSLQWHALSVRSHVHYDFSVPAEESTMPGALRAALLACPLSVEHAARSGVEEPVGGPSGKARSGCEEIENLGRLVERLRRAGLDEEEVVDGLNLRTSA